MTPDSSSFIIARDPFRAIRRGRQIFQRKFTRANGQGPLEMDGGDPTIPGSDPRGIHNTLIIGAGLSDSCASCHGRPRGSAGAGGDVATRPDSRDAPHLFGLGLKEMLADEITTDLRAIRTQALADARRLQTTITRNLTSKGISYGQIIARRDGTVDTSRVQGVNPDLRVRPFFLHGDTISIREFLVGAFNAEMGLESFDPFLKAADGGARVVTPAGMVLDGRLDNIEAPPASSLTDDPDDDGKMNEIPESIVDFMEFYLLHYFKAARGETNADTGVGRDLVTRPTSQGGLGCATCHIPDLTINRDRRVADVETRFDPVQGNPFNRLFATATPLLVEQNDGSGYPTIKRPAGNPFTVRFIFTDFKRHDLGPNFHENNYDGTVRTQFLTTPLWGVADTAPYGHDGRSMNLRDVILRHGGEAQAARDRFRGLSATAQRQVIQFLDSLVLFPPDDTASNLDPGDRANARYPQVGHGSIRLTTIFNNPADPE
ncbi:MAG TPA: di-heme oxidoredictase family protein [Vicinamibacteria bacterium]